MRICGILVKLDKKCERIAESRGFWPFKRIVVGPQWYSLMPREQLAVLYHEVGHCVKLHMERRLLMLPLLFLAPGFVKRVSCEQELEADRFAASQGYGVDLAAMLSRMIQDEGMFYPSVAVRRAALMEAQNESTS